MRVIEASLEEDLSLFSRYLWQQRIRHRIFEERGRQIVEVAEAAAAEPVKKAYDAWRSGRLVLEARAATPAGNSDRLARLLRLGRRFPVLITLGVLVILIFPFSAPVADGELTAVAAALTFLDLGGTSKPVFSSIIETGQFWRLFTPVLLHFSVVHLLFNVAVVTDFGRRIELGRGSLRFALLVILIAVVSNVGQFVVAGNPVFGGLSGVAYGLLGYVLVSRRRFPEQIPWQVHPGFAISLLVFLVVFSTGITEPFGLYVANAAHWSGLVSGGLLALLIPLPASRSVG